ncbi:mannitol dehydrogenase family protein [Flavobacterium sp. SM2513]|uniref:mannitol dehydrogenase family protein n=1 Tax=Flavobacterium sp. SM2513 TaxID=3424766 RepID=UPI003D7F5CA1
MNTVDPDYSSKNNTSGILHIGVGNFHRAHEAFYTHQLLAHENQQNWGICGVSLLPSDKNIIERLKQQNLAYTLTVFGRNNTEEVHTIGSIVELIAGYENPEAVLQKIESPSIKIISLTITEGGYNLDKGTGLFNVGDEKIQQDLKNPKQPKTAFGFIAEGLRRRKEAGNGAITILSCDNLQHNGDTAKKAFTSFIKEQDNELAEWVNLNVTFPNSMVDRITPATTAADIERLNKKNGTNDLVPVYCEDFIQWVIEDNFAAGRPKWELVGVEFTENVTAFENMKLSLLNASHTLLAYPSFLKGYRAVDQAMQDADLVKFIRTFMDVDITPYVHQPENTNLEVYKQTLIERFSNPAVSDQVSRLCFDGISKFPVYIVPNVLKMLEDQKDMTRIAFLLATYRHYLKYKVDDNGTAFEIAEPWMTEEDERIIAIDEPLCFLTLSPFKPVDFSKSTHFLELYSKFVVDLEEQGVGQVLNAVVS